MFKGRRAKGQPRENWKTVLYASFVAQMLSIIGFSASIPFIPLYLTRELHVANVAEAGLWAGVMGAMSSVAMAIMAPVWGGLADRFGRKSMVLRAMIGGCALVMVMSLSQNVWWLLILRVLQGSLTGTVPANVALVASITPRHRMGYALGIMQTAVFAGSSIGPLIGGPLADLVGYRLTFAVTSLGLGLGALIVFFFVEEEFTPVRPDSQVRRVSLTSRYRMVLGQPVFVALVIMLALVHFSNHVVGPVLALFIKTLNGTDNGAATLAGLELGITGITSACAAGLAGMLSDRFGHRRVLVISLVAAGMLNFPQAAVGNVWQLLILRGTMGLFFGGIIPSANALISQLIPEERKGMAYGVVSSVTSLGFAAAPLTGSVVAAVLNFQAVFMLTGVVLLLTAGWANRVLARVPGESSEQSKAEVPDSLKTS